MRECNSDWCLLVEEYDSKLGKRYLYKNEEYTFFGLVFAEDDWYYLMCSGPNKYILSSCVGKLEDSGFIEL